MKRIALVLFCAAMFLVFVVEAQVRNISGVVTSSDRGAVISGVSVVVKGTTIGTITNTDGQYSLNVPEDAGTLVFSFVGMVTQELSISGSRLNVVMSPNAFELDEVIAVAYGTVSKESFTGSASVIKSDNLEKIQTSSISKAIQGMSAGVMIANSSGQPGTNAEIRIRGINTFGNAEPLIVIDGFPFDGNINSIATNDVESMTILKDASATALYGSRAANGVIMITTKKGQKGATSFEVKASYGVNSRAIEEYDRVNVSEYYELQWEGIRNTLITAGSEAQQAAIDASDKLISTLGGYNVFNVPDNQVVNIDGSITSTGQLLWTDDWQEESYSNGSRQEIVLNASGGTEKTDYFLSGSVLDDEGIIKASEFKRYSIRLNLNSELQDWVTVGMNLSGSLSKQNFPTSSGSSYMNSVLFARNVAPIYPVYLYDDNGALQTDADGNKIYDFGGEYGRARSFASNANPLGAIELDTREYGRDIFSMRTYADFKIWDGLSLKVSLATDYNGYSALTHENQKYGSSANFKGRSTRSAGRTFSYTANELLTYDKSFGDHNISVLLGHENYKYKYNWLTATRTGFPFPGLVELDAAATAEGSGSYEHNYRIESYLAKVDYNLRDRYFASFNFRADGNSRFSENARWGEFWGAGVSWVISEETFLDAAEWVNSLKLKASYGEQGSDKIDSYYAYQGLYEAGWNNMDYPGLLASRLATPGLTWEALKSTNIGAEFSFLDRFFVNVEYYVRNNKDLLFEKPLAPSTGFNIIEENIAELQNSGIEIEAGALLINQNNFKWNFDLNLSHNKNEIKSMPQENIINGSQKWEVGKSIYDFWIRDFAGVNPDNGKSQWYFDVQETDNNGTPLFDENGNPLLTGERDVTEVFSESDRYYVGSAIPDLTGGLINSFEYSNFDFTLMLNFAVGGKVLDGSYRKLMHGGTYGVNWHTDILNRWTTDNRDTDVPIIDGDQNANATSTRFLVDGDYLNFRSVNLGYTFPTHITTNLNIQSLRLYFAADNILLISKRKGLDPQQTFSGIPGNNYPPIRTVSFGLNVKF